MQDSSCSRPFPSTVPLPRCTNVACVCLAFLLIREIPSMFWEPLLSAYECASNWLQGGREHPVPLARVSDSGRDTGPWSSQSEPIPGFCWCYGERGALFPGFTKLEAYKHTRRSPFVILWKFLDENEANTKSGDREKVHEEIIWMPGSDCTDGKMTLMFEVYHLLHLLFLKTRVWVGFPSLTAGSPVWHTPTAYSA